VVSRLPQGRHRDASDGNAPEHGDATGEGVPSRRIMLHPAAMGSSLRRPPGKALQDKVDAKKTAERSTQFFIFSIHFIALQCSLKFSH
jgi:hypothetical protein